MTARIRATLALVGMAAALVAAGCLGESRGMSQAATPGSGDGAKPEGPSASVSPERSTGRHPALASQVTREALETVLELRGVEQEVLQGFRILTLPGEGPAVRVLWSVPDGSGRHPAVVLNHGGFDGFSLSFLAAARRWREAGFAVAASEYRGEGESPGTADYAGGEVSDVLRLVRWVRARPEVDPERIAMVGYSRGATVALLAAARGADVDPIVVYSPVTDISAMLDGSDRVQAILARQDLAFDPEDPRQVRARSPILATEDIRAPVLLLHGGRDPLVPPSQSERFAQSLRAAGGDAVVRIFPDAAHHLKDHPGTFEVARAYIEARFEGGKARATVQRPAWSLALQERGIQAPRGEAYAGVLHGGIYQRMSYRDMTYDMRDNLNHPLLAGIDFNAAWALIETEPDRYDWSWIDRPLRAWGGAGKRIVVNVITVHPRGVNPVAGHATPTWVYERGADKITVVTRGKGRTAGMTADYPLFWDPVYLREYEDFVRAMAHRYDGHPDIDVVGIGVAKLGGLTVIDPKISGEERRALLGFYRRNGYSRDRWFQTIQQIVHIYQRHFRKTPLRINLSNSFDKEDLSPENLAMFARVGDWAASQGIHLFYQGVSGGEEYAQKMERKPIDEIFRRNAGRVLTGMELIHPVHGGPTRFMGGIRQNVENALGLAPGVERTRITWLNFYRKDCNASNPIDPAFEREWWEAFLLGLDHLRMVREEPAGGGDGSSAD